MKMQLLSEQLTLATIFCTQPTPTASAAAAVATKQIKEREYTIVHCDHCKAEYSNEEFKRLPRTGYNAVWNFVYRRCPGCGKDITPLKLNETAIIGVEKEVKLKHG